MLYPFTFRITRFLHVFPRAVSRILTVCCLALCFSSGAQGLEIDSLVFPEHPSDTLELNSTVSVRIILHNADSSSQLGNLKIWFRNESNNFNELPLGGFNALQFFAPGQSRQVDLEVPVTPEFFIEGGNTVVIWPSFVGEDVVPGPGSVVRNIFIRTSSALNHVKEEKNSYMLPNPVYDILYIQPFENSAVPEEMIIRDLSGKFVLGKAWSKEESMNVEMIAPGIYILELRLAGGGRYLQRIVKSTR